MDNPACVPKPTRAPRSLYLPCWNLMIWGNFEAVAHTKRFPWRSASTRWTGNSNTPGGEWGQFRQIAPPKKREREQRALRVWRKWRASARKNSVSVINRTVFSSLEQQQRCPTYSGSSTTACRWLQFTSFGLGSSRPNNLPLLFRRLWRLVPSRCWESHTNDANRCQNRF